MMSHTHRIPISTWYYRWLRQLLDNTGSIGTIVTSIKEKLLEKKTRVEGQVVHELCLNEVPNYTKLFNERQY